MNSLLNDLRRAVCSLPFAAAVLIQLLILRSSGFDSDLYRMSVPLVCTFPYTCAWLDESKSGFFRLALPRTTVFWYITGKYAACTVTGGLAELTAALLFIRTKPDAQTPENLPLIFLCGALWAGISALLAAVSGSKYPAYGGGFVVCYFLVILHERYWKTCYFIDPYEWLTPQQTWEFGPAGLRLMLGGLILLTGLCYGVILERRLSNA